MIRGVTRAVILAAVAVLAVGGPVLAVAPSAEAHNYLVASTPTAGETLTTVPDAFEVVTNEPLLTLGGSTAAFAFQIVDSSGRHYETGCVSIEGASMSTDARLGPAGEYTALWQVVSEDGHSVSGSIPFTWAPADESQISEGASSAPACGESPVDSPTSTPTPVAIPETATPTAVPISDVLWIGGAVLAAGAAVGIAILVLGRRKPTP